MNRKSKKRPLSRLPEYNDMLNTWSFTHGLMKATGRRGKVQHLDKMDLDFIGDRDQIKIWARSVRAYIQHDTEVVSVFMRLPDKVDRIIIFRYGQRDPVCYAENFGKSIHPGTDLQHNPFTFNEELRRLRMLRRRRKYLF